MKLRNLALLVIVAIAIISLSTQAMADGLPMDKIAAISVTTPDPNLPAEIRAFAGKWKGTWMSSTNTIVCEAVIAVEKIEKQGNDIVTVIHNFRGGSDLWNLKPEYTKYNATFQKKGGEIILSFTTPQTKTRFEFRINKDGKMEGNRSIGSFLTTITMERLP